MTPETAAGRRPLSAVVTELRARFAAALTEAGPDAPTLCAGWTAHDLAAHAVARQRRPWADVGLVVPALEGVTERARQAFTRRPFEELVRLAGGRPVWWSPFGLPGVGPLADLVEYAVHTEDVRRGAGLPAVPDVDGLPEAIARQIRAQGRMLTRRVPVPLQAQTPQGQVLVARRDSGRGPGVTVTGAPIEVLLYLTGRREAAAVEVAGADADLEALAAAQLGL